MPDTASPRPVEIELKLLADAASLAHLAERLADLVPGASPAAVKRLETTYYDTPELALAQLGVSVRLRRDGRRRLQSVKVRHVPGVIERGEWEWPIAGRSLDLALLRHGEVGALLPPSVLPRLRPVFTTAVTRTIHRVRFEDGCEIELALDRGAVAADDGAGGKAAVPIHEVELELKAAPAKAPGTLHLYELALDLHGAAPLMIATASKADRGYALISGQAPLVAAPPELALAADVSMSDGMAAIFGASFRELLANQTAALAGDVEGVHRMRVALRRLRGAFKLFRGIVGRGDVGHLSRDLKWLSGELGVARDWDVFVSGTVPLLSETDGLDTAALAEAARRRQGAARKALADAIRSPRYTSLVLNVGAWIEGAGWRDASAPAAGKALDKPLAKAADRLLARLADKVAAAGDGIRRLDETERHELRKAVKALRYGVAFLATLYGNAATKDYRRRLTDLQDVLGELNDLAVGRRLATGLDRRDGHRADARAIAGRLERCAAKSLDSLPKAWHRFQKVKPFWE
jgi:inorganic triphosphatase YgiF